MTDHDPAELAEFDQRLAAVNSDLDDLTAAYLEVGETTDDPVNLTLLQEWLIEGCDRVTVAALAAAAIRRLAGQPSWIHMGTYPPAFLATVAAHLEAHDDADVRELGARLRDANSAA